MLKSQEAIALGDGYISTVSHWEQSYTRDDGHQSNRPGARNRNHPGDRARLALRNRPCVIWSIRECGWKFLP